MRVSVFSVATFAVFISCIYCIPVQNQGGKKDDRPSVNTAPLQGQKQDQGLVVLQTSGKNESLLDGGPEKPKQRPGLNLGSPSFVDNRQQNADNIGGGRKQELSQRQE
ncbi:hypothetical protein ACJMK2_026573 [Sinanodonta woodiana]|uniref:Secreted protein n=1 Tax=Sinanodonta woodiana TaxID=1069815 RepID=A0ABD3XK89_SINWO